MIPARQNGSSIMPGKINPVIPEVVSQVAYLIIGHDYTITMAAEAGQLELNAFEPVLFHHLFESIDTLKEAAATLTKHCITGITANKGQCEEYIEKSVGISTALCPYIGYAKSAEIAKKSLKTGISVKELVLEEGLLKEEELKEMMRGVESACSQLNMEVMGGHTEITDVVKHPLISVTGVGTIKKEEVLVTSSVKPGQDIVITKWIGLEGTSIAAKEKEAELLERFAPSFVETAKHFDQYLSVVPEAKIAKEWGVSAMHDITEGGVFGALWEMGSGSNVGLDIDLKKIPIRQETVEVCELLGLNPYILMSSGSMMIATDDGYGLVRKLNQAGIEASVIGKATDKNERILRNGEETRYMDKPQSDELYKIYQ